MRILSVIPARGGSKGLPGKNLRQLNGKSLIQHAYDCAVESGVCDRVVLTSDCDEMLRHYMDFVRLKDVDAMIKRPALLARDDTPMHEVVQHALWHCDSQQWDAVMLLQPTSPLRTPEQLRKAVELLSQKRLEPGDSIAKIPTSVVSVNTVPKTGSPPYLMRTSGPWIERYSNLTRRQDVPPAYKRDGTVYLTRFAYAVHGDLYGPRCMPLILDDGESCSVDDEADLSRCQQHLSDVAPSAGS